MIAVAVQKGCKVRSRWDRLRLAGTIKYPYFCFHIFWLQSTVPLGPIETGAFLNLTRPLRYRVLQSTVPLGPIETVDYVLI